MTRGYRGAGAVALAASALVLVAACSGGSDGDPPEPAQYQQPPGDLCEQIPFEEVLQRAGLGPPPPPYTEPSPNYRTARTFEEVRCSFAGVVQDGRFTTELGVFAPTGGVEVTVHDEVADDATRRYDNHAEGLFERPDGAEPAEVTGWWDEGVSVTLTEEVDPADRVDLDDDDEITGLQSRLLVRHENLVVLVYTNGGYSPTEEAEEAGALLAEVVAAVLEEAVEPLSRTTE